MTETLRLVIVRACSAALTLFGVSVVVFMAIHLLPGDLTSVLAPRGPVELREAILLKFGLDQPLHVQFVKWQGNIVSGDFGVSLITQEPISEAFASRVPITLELSALALCLSLVVGGVIGLWSALNHDSPLKSASGKLAGSVLMSIPDFILASAFLYVFSRYALGLTVGKWTALAVDPDAHLRAIVLPVLTLSALGVGLFAVTTRTAALSILSQDYIGAAIARGMSRGEILRHHIPRNIAVSLVTSVTIFAGYLVGGAVVVETLYSIPGLGRFLIQAVLNRDYPVVQAGVLLIAASVVLLNMAADILYGVIDPRLRK
jgi:peptide/nickel transport system permease protein